MSSRLQLDVCNLSLGMHHLVNAYEVKAGIGLIAGNTVLSMPECLACTTKMSAILIHLRLPFLHDPLAHNFWKEVSVYSHARLGLGFELGFWFLDYGTASERSRSTEWSAVNISKA